MGSSALQKQLTDTVGLVSSLPQFAGARSRPIGARFVVGGHEIRDGTLVESLERLHTRQPRVRSASWSRRAAANWRPSTPAFGPARFTNCGATIGGLAGAVDARFRRTRPPRDAIERLQADLQEFQQQASVDRVIVVNLASTEPADRLRRPARRGGTTSTRLLDEGPPRSLPASSLYAIAALDLGMPYINFTPSLGCDAAGDPANWPSCASTCHAGQDGKTGETLLKSVLAPMFAARNLEVMSWVGHNIFGNMDGQVLDDPANKAAKIKGKDQLVGNILGYDPQTLVSIEYIRSLGDWKTAWDHIHFRGFLGHADDAAIHLAGVRFAARGAAGAGPGAVRRTVARRGEDRRAQPLGQLFQTAAGPRRTRFFPAIFAALRVGRAARSDEVACDGAIAELRSSSRTIGRSHVRVDRVSALV